MMFEHMHQCIVQIKESNPLVLNLTNYVTMEWVANGLLSLGASPIMTESTEELDDLIQIAHAVVINIGTLEDTFLARAAHACATANRLNKPLIFDPVGAGASFYRTRTCLNFLEQFNFTVIRGNASEVMVLAGDHVKTKGVDSLSQTCDAIESAQRLSITYQTTVAVSGATDLVIRDQQVKKLDRGSPLMTRVTGTGCLLTAVVAAFNAVSTDAYTATASALLFYSVCGELAAQKSYGPGSFQANFLDELFC